MRSTLFYFCLSISTLLFSQTTQLGFGLRTDSYTIVGSNTIEINDSIVFSNYESSSNPVNGTIRGDARFAFFIERLVLEGQKGSIGIAVYYSRQWPQIAIGRVVDDPSSPFPITFYTPVVSKSEFFVPIQANIKPFTNASLFSSIRLLKSISIGMGIGPSFQFGNIASRIDGFELNLSNDREDPFFYETYYQFAKSSFKTITFNYTWSIHTELFWHFGLKVVGQGSLNTVTNSFKVYGEEFEVPLKRRGLAFLITYSLDIPKNK